MTLRPQSSNHHLDPFWNYDRGFGIMASKPGGTHDPPSGFDAWLSEG